jgi:hypothetical protein
MFKTIDNIPNTYLFNDVDSLHNGSSIYNNVSQIKPRPGCTNKVSSFSETKSPIVSTTLVNNGQNGYDTISSTNLYASAFDELGEPDMDDKMDELSPANNKKVPPEEYKVNLSTHIYIGSISIIGLFALYRMLQKTR